MSTWVVAVHEFSGSTSEAVDVRWCVSFPTEDEAERFTSTLNDWLERLTRQYGYEMFAQCFEVLAYQQVHWPRPTPEDVEKHATPEDRAILAEHPDTPMIDIKRLAVMLFDDEDIEVER